MENILASIERENHIRHIFLCIFSEDGIPKEELENAICKSYSTDKEHYESIKDIPIDEIEEAICESCEVAGIEFKDIDDILKYFYKMNKSWFEG